MTSETELVLYRPASKANSKLGARKPAFIQKGRKWIKVVMLDSPIVVVKVPVSEARYMLPSDFQDKKGRYQGLRYKSGPYPVKRAVRLFLKSARIHGISKSARTILRSAVV